jgi:hypothetical protein
MCGTHGGSLSECREEERLAKEGHTEKSLARAQRELDDREREQDSERKFSREGLAAAKRSLGKPAQEPDTKEASKGQSQRFAEREAARMAAMTKLLAGGTAWAVDTESKTVRANGINLSLTDLLVLHDALVLAADVKCPHCGFLAVVRGNHCCGSTT